MDRIRVASLQYYLRPVRSFDDFKNQVEASVETAADYGCRLIVFPEYFTVQLLTLGDIRRPMTEQIRDLAGHHHQFVELMSSLAMRFGVYMVGGSIPVMENGDTVYNEDWKVKSRTGLRVFETDFGRLAVAICYDVEFPEIARAAARLDAHILCVPSCTDDRQGFLRVRYCAHARAIENHMYVIPSHTVGSLPMVPAVHLNYGQAAILTPSDFPFSRDGLLAEGNPNQEMMVIGELNLETILSSRTTGTVLPLEDSRRTAELVADPTVVIV